MTSLDINQDQQLKFELNKVLTQQQQWHDDFQLKLKEYDQRDRHWFWQRGFWLFMGGASLMAIVLKTFPELL